MTEQRPWWASGEAPGSHRGDDPVVAFRTARRAGTTSFDLLRDLQEGGTADGHGVGAGDDEVGVGEASGDGSGVGQAGAGEVRRARGCGGSTDPSVVAACGVCPWCTTVRVLAQHHPELLGHLREAGRHLGAAARAVLEVTVATPADPETDGAEHRVASTDAAAPGSAADDPPADPAQAGGTPPAPADGRLHRIALGRDDHR